MGILNAKLNFSFLCDYASISREGKLSMNGIFEQINAKSFPVSHPLMYIVANISGVNDKDNFTCELSPLDEPQKKIVTIKNQVMVNAQQNFGFIGQLINVKFEKPGKYVIKFYIDNKEIGSHIFLLRSI